MSRMGQFLLWSYEQLVANHSLNCIGFHTNGVSLLADRNGVKRRQFFTDKVLEETLSVGIGITARPPIRLVRIVLGYQPALPELRLLFRSLDGFTNGGDLMRRGWPAEGQCQFVNACRLVAPRKGQAFLRCSIK